MSDGAASMMPPKSDQRLASWVLWNGWADDHPAASEIEWIGFLGFDFHPTCRCNMAIGTS
jgi:hypothetical protein